MTQLIIVRHGESIANKEGLFLGHSDLDLTEIGVRQAELVAEYLEGFHIDKIYSSDLKRAYNTALPTAIKKNMPITTLEGLREINGGEWEEKPFDRLYEIFSESYGKWVSDFGNARCDGGESTRELWDRIERTLNKIVSENEGKSVMIATHATPIRVMCAIFDNIPISKLDTIKWVSNASITRVNYEKGTYKVLDADFSGHLGKLITKLPNCI